jgi:Zn-dependent metalloprotease
MSKLYVGPADSGGVHINSGIPNRAFVLVAQAFGRPA